MAINEKIQKIKLFFIGLGSGIMATFAFILGILCNNKRRNNRIERDSEQLQDIGEELHSESERLESITSRLQSVTDGIGEDNRELHSNTDRLERIITDIEKRKP